MGELKEPPEPKKVGKARLRKTGALSQALPPLHLNLDLRSAGWGAGPKGSGFQKNGLSQTRPDKSLRAAEAVTTSSGAAFSCCARTSGSCLST